VGFKTTVCLGFAFAYLQQMATTTIMTTRANIPPIIPPTIAPTLNIKINRPK
jgi:hypothetical protein